MPEKRKFRLLKSKEMSEQLEILSMILQLNTTVLADRKKTQEESGACSYTPPHGLHYPLKGFPLPKKTGEETGGRDQEHHMRKKQPRVKSQHCPLSNTDEIQQFYHSRTYCWCPSQIFLMMEPDYSAIFCTEKYEELDI